MPISAAMMDLKLDTFQVQPALPEELKGLREMAYNLVWQWDEPVREIFRRLAPQLSLRRRRHAGQLRRGVHLG